MAAVGDYGADPDALLEWLSSGSEEMRDMQTMALEHLCMALLMSDNVDRCFETYPPKTFIPPLCMIFLDATAPDGILEATARALTYYLDVSAECTRRIMSVEGTVRAICNRLMIASLDSQTGKDLAEQCIKVLEHISSRDVSCLSEAGALNSVLTFIETYGTSLHKDALRSAMGIVTRLCTKIEPSDESVSGIVESLTALLKHSDAQVADSALKCFSALAERFARRNGNAEILSRHGLVDVLLQRLENVPRTSMSLTRVSTSASESFSSAISVLSLLHNLVRESDAVCTTLANSRSLSKAALIVLESDDRCISELTRLMEVLLVVLLDGRHALPKSINSSGERGGFRRFENDRSNRHLIEVIRNRDFDGLVDAVENGSVDVNLVDDVGQSLLNWCAAFGTLEMVEFLCERGADVNKGQRSSSLHYAACFGRVGILKILLQYGADASLKDEDGKTALEKAQERNEEGHSEIVKLLTEPHNWTAPPPKFVRKERLVLNTASEQKGLDVSKGTELALNMLPLFIQLVSTTMSSTVRRSAAMLVQKMVTWIPVERFKVSGEDFQNAIVKMLSVLMSSEDDASFAVALDVVDLLATKFGVDFLNSMYCAGIVSQIGGKAAEEKQRLAAETGRSSPSIDVDSVRVQKFGEWYILKGSVSLCLWSDFIVIELPNSSSGWFQTFINGKVSTVRSGKESKNAEISSEGLYLDTKSTEPQSQSLKKLMETVQDLRNDETFSFMTFIGTEATRFGDWVFTCMEGRILRINNTESTSEVQIRHNLTDTVVVSKAGDNSRSLVALTKVLSGCGQEGGLTLGSTERHKEQAAKRRTQKLALQLYSKYFENARHNPRRPLGRLIDAIARLEESVVQQKQQQIQHLRGEKQWLEEFKGGVRDLIMAIGDGNILSAYEILSTDLVKVLITVFGADDMSPHDSSMRSQRIELWKSIFKVEASRSGEQPASQILVRTLVKMLEASEKLPVYVADSTVPGGGFQALTRSIVLELEMRESSTQLMDRSGKKIRVEPLVTVREMDEYLWKKLFKKWHDHERSQLNFVKRLRENDARLSFSHLNDFDDNGILHWVGTNGSTPGVEWVNPVSSGLMAITSCDSKLLPCGSVSDFVSRSPVPLYVRTADTKEPWFAIDTGLMIEPTHYTLRHGRGSGALRNWLFQASKDAVTWQTLRSHNNDNSLSAVGSTSTWQVSEILSSTPWRYFRLQMLGENSEFETCMCISGFELYGVVTGVCDDVGKAFKESPMKRFRGSGREVNVDMGRLEPPLQSSSATSRVTGSRSAIQHRVSNSTLSLPETSGFGLPFGGHVAEQAVSTGHLHRPIEAQPTGILRAMPTSNLSRFGSETGQFWQAASMTEREASEEPAPSGRLSSSRVSESNGSVSHDADLPISSTSSDFASTSQLTHDLSSLQSEQSTPVGSTLSLSESVDYNTAALNQLSLSAPNLASHSNSSGSEPSSRFSHLRLLGRGLRTAFSNLQSSRPEPTLMVPEESESSSSLSGAQSFPTLTQQEVLLDPLRFAPNSRTRAFLAALRSIATDDTPSSSSNNVHLDLREALDLTFRDDDAEGRESDAFVTLADFAYRTLQGSRASRDSEMTEEGSSEDEPQEQNRHKSAVWNEDYVLKRQFSSLIPNFDPRPGRNNVSQTTEIDVETPARSELSNLFENSKRKDELKVSLSLRMSGTSQGEVYPLSPDENLLSLMQRLWVACDVDPKQARSRKNWDSAISLVYGDKNLLSTSESRSSNSSASVVYPSCNPSNPEVVADILHLLRNLVDIASPPKMDCPVASGNDSPTSCFVADPTDFHSAKIASKMLTHLNNYAAVAADPTALPPWCDSLMVDYPFILPYETRRSCFASTAFGCERTIVWLQNLREQQQEGSRSGRLEALLHNFRLGRLLHLRIRKISRHHILDSAMAALFRHAHSKSVLEVEFESEEGTGLGPTLEFFSLIAAELQRKDLAMWICDDQQIPSRTDMVDLGSGWKFPGFYVSSAGGLFPAPYPPEHPGLAQLKNLYRLLGICVGKALIDDRLLDLPLSPSFFKMICTDGRRTVLDGSHHSLSAAASDPLFTSVMDNSSKKNRRQQRRNKKTSLRAIYRPSTAPWFGVLGLDHLEQIDPHRGRFIRGLLSLIKKRQLITDDLMLNEDQKREKLRTLSFEFANGNRTEFIRLDDLGLTFEFNPASKVFNYLSCDLIAEGDTIPVTIENVDLYVDLTLDFCFNSGIRVQMDAFREGLEQVLPLEKLRLFTPEELRTHVSGDQAPTWTRSDIMQFTEPKLGYTQDSPTFKRFVNVLVNLTPDERKAFVYFVTGSSSLPPGGLANLFPRLTVVKKISNTENEGYPSVNTCVHFLKLPEYSSEQILYERLMAATRERGFYYN